MIDPAYISAFAALVGTFVGGITSIATSWLGQQRQSKEQRRAREKTELQALYKQFIQEASKLYLDALEHNKTEISKLVDAYENENTTFSDIIHSINKGLVDPLRPFSEACHEELRTY
jgi:gas vesicle protein